MSASFTNQTLAQIELFANNKDGKYKKKVYVLPKSLDEKVARLHLAKIGVKLTKLRPDQAELHRRQAGRPVQVGSLPVLIAPVAHRQNANGRAMPGHFCYMSHRRGTRDGQKGLESRSRGRQESRQEGCEETLDESREENRCR